MVEMLTRGDGLDGQRDPVLVEGVALHPKQAERLGAWLEDQKATAEALGQSSEAWLRALERGFGQYAARVQGEAFSEAPSPPPEATDLARRLVSGGIEQTAFENRPTPGQSQKSGLQGLLSARSFATKDQPRKKRPK